VRHGKVHDLRDKVSRRRLAHQEPHLLKRVGSPREEDDEGNDNGANWVQVPDEPVTDNRHDETKNIDDNVVAVVDEEDVDRWEASVEKAVDHERSLGKNCDVVSNKFAPMNFTGLFVLATPTKTSGMTWSSFESCSPPPRVRPDSMMSWMATVVIKAQKRMMPIVSIRVLPYSMSAINSVRSR